MSQSKTALLVKYVYTNKEFDCDFLFVNLTSADKVCFVCVVEKQW